MSFRPMSPAILATCMVAFVVCVLVACGSEPTPTPEPTSTPVPPPTATPVPTPTPIPSPTPTPHITPSRETLMPEGSSLVVDARPSEILDSAVFAITVELTLEGDESGEGLLAGFENESGIDPLAVEYVEAFVDLEAFLKAALSADPGEDLPAPTMGMVLHGEFDKEGLLTRLEEEAKGEVGVQNYRGYQLYSGDTDLSGDSVFSFLDSGTLLFGTADGVKAMIDVAEGVDAPLSAEAMQALDALGDRHLGMILSTPPEVMQMAAEGSEYGMAMLGMLDPTALSSPLTVSRVYMGDSAMEISTRQFFEEEADARASKEYSEGTMAMLGVMLDSPEIQQLVGGIAIDQNGKEVTTFLSTDEAQLGAIFGFLTGLMSLGSAEPLN